MHVLPFMKCVARAVLGEGVEKLVKLAAEFVPFGGFALEFVAGVARRTADEMRLEGVVPRQAVEVQAALPDADARSTAEATVAEVAPQLPAPQRKLLVEYLTQLPHTLRATLKRPEDPDGRTVPADWDFADPRTLAQALPAGLPRFSPGDDAPEPGWKLVRLLGRGGMGEVWLGQHQGYKNLLAAFKFCLDPFAQKSLLEREGGIVDRLTGLSMPGVVTMLGADAHAAAPWLKYQFIPHGDLTQLLHRWKDDPPQARTVKILKLWHRLAVIVGRLHDLEDPIVHRDLKPANVLVRWHERTNDYDLFVADFGIGSVTARRSIEEATRRPDATASLGLLRGACTPVYASLQQQAGDKPSVRDDVFSLGVIGYQLLMGRFDRRIPAGKGWKAALGKIHVPAGVIDLLETCCEEEPADRPAGATALAEALGEAMAGSPLKPTSGHNPGAIRVSPPAAGTVLSNSLGMKFAFVPAGSFWMGGGGGKPGEKLVEIANDFYLGVYPVTQGEWQAVMGNNPSYFSRSGIGKGKVQGLSDADLRRLPIEQVNCDDVQEFIDRLNQKSPLDGYLYRLPAEAEWEYACRNGAGSKDQSAFHFYLDRLTNDLSPSQANFNKTLGRTSQVGLYKPNALGIYDLHGNVWEWCLDAEGSERVVRGGGWDDLREHCFAGFCNSCDPLDRDYFLGFRLALRSAG